MLQRGAAVTRRHDWCEFISGWTQSETEATGRVGKNEVWSWQRVLCIDSYSL